MLKDIKTRLVTLIGSTLALAFVCLSTTSFVANASKKDALVSTTSVKNDSQDDDISRVFWENDGTHGEIDWSSSGYKFGLDGTDPYSECITTFPQEIWGRIKTEMFCLDFASSDYFTIRVATGWWDQTWTSDDIMPGNPLLTDNQDGTFTLKINLTSNPEFVESLDEKHLLFIGSEYTPLRLYFSEVIWENDGSRGDPDWIKYTYRFAGKGHETTDAIAIIPAEQWEKIKTGTFYMDFDIVPNTDVMICVTNGLWDKNWRRENEGRILLDDPAVYETELGDTDYTIKMNFTDNIEFVETLDDSHLLFTGQGYIPKKIYFANSDIVSEQRKSDIRKNHGYLQTSKIVANEGDIVSVKPIPLPGFKYKKDSLRVIELSSTNYLNPISLSLTDEEIYTFEVPDVDVMVTAEFVSLHDHDIKLVKGVAPTILSYGYKDYYACEACHEYFEDKNGMFPIYDLEAWKVTTGSLSPTLGIGPFIGIVAGSVAALGAIIITVVLIKQRKVKKDSL